MKKKVLGIVLATVLVLSLGLVFTVPVAASPGMAGLWHFDDGSGGTALDSSGNNNHGVLRLGTYLEFDGNDYVSVPDDSSLDITTELTIEARVKTDVTMDDNAKMQIVDKGEHQYHTAYMLMIWQGNLYGRVGSSSTTCQSPYPDDGKWHHVAYTFKSGEQKLYIDGSVVATNNGITSISTNAQPLLIGNGVERSYYWDGLIDEVRISNVARTSFEACGVPTVDVNTVALWHFDEGDGQEAADETTNDNDGQLGSNSDPGGDDNDPTWIESGPTWATGICGDALSFDGVDDCVCLPASNSIINTGTFTVEAWFKTSVNHPVYGSGTKEGRLVNLHRMSTASTAVSLYVEQDMIGLLYWNGSNHIFVKHTVNYHDDVWHHIAVTYDGSTYSLCYDGTQVASQTDTFGGFGSFPAYIGTYNGSERFFNGLIDEIRIWDTATPTFTVEADPDEDTNAPCTDHEVDVKVTVDGSEPAPCVAVNLLVTAGPNIGASDSDSTNCDGEATLSYTDCGGSGQTDTITIWVDQDCSGGFDETKDAYEEVTKDWVALASLSHEGGGAGPAFNLVGEEHCVTATIDQAVSGIPVNFIVLGLNFCTGTETTDAGDAEFCYTGMYPGKDTIIAWLETNCRCGFQMFGRNPDDWCYVTKYYLNHRITGGGNITEGRGRGSAKITFGGNVGIAGDEGLVGQYQINFHNVSDDEVGNIDVAKGHFHSTDITFLDFKWLILCPQPDPPDDAFFNWAEFKADGRFNGEPGWSIHVRVTDYGEGKKAKPDTIRIKLYKGSILEYDSNQDFPYDWVCLTSEWRMHELDGGNIQIHKIDD